MKAYKHEYNPHKKIIETIEFEVDEKPKTYVVKRGAKGIWYSRINKEDFGILNGFGNSMFSLSPDVKEYAEKLISKHKKKIEILEKEIFDKKQIIEDISSILSCGGE